MNNKKNEDRGEDKGLKLIFNHDDVFFSFFYDDDEVCVHRSRDYALNYVRSGCMVLDSGKERITVSKGECVFIPRDHRIEMYKKGCDGERYCGIYMRFTRPFLRKMYQTLNIGENHSASPRTEPQVVKLPASAELESLFVSMQPYFDPSVKPEPYFMNLKLQEGLLALLNIDDRFAPMLFDFNELWKIDIMAFMNENYMYDLTVEEMAHYTGRSPSTFKRDFRKICDLTPSKWLTRRRLEAAYDILKERGAKISEVCADVGFKNISHFSTVFKKQYGISPTELCR